MNMAAQAPYHLDLDHQKRNVFVTQLHDRDDEDTTYFPVVKDLGDKLIETGINTLQRTLLLKTEVEVDKVNAQLEAKRYEFKQRMESCAHRQIQVQKKQQQMKDRVTKFEKFIQENESKRRRAIQKYQKEVEVREQKAIEFSSLSDQLEHFKKRHKQLQEKLKAYKIFEEYLQKVIDAMPEDYLPATEDKIKGLMMRHKTLSESNRVLVENHEKLVDELEDCKKEHDTLNQEYQKEKLSKTSNLSQMQETHEKMTDNNELSEQNFLRGKDEMRSKRTDVGIVFMAIENIFDKCRKLNDLPVDKSNWDEKLNRIKEYLSERQGVIHLVNTNIENGETSNLSSASPEHSMTRQKQKENTTKT